MILTFASFASISALALAAAASCATPPRHGHVTLSEVLSGTHSGSHSERTPLPCGKTSFHPRIYAVGAGVGRDALRVVNMGNEFRARDTHQDGSLPSA